MTSAKQLKFIHMGGAEILEKISKAFYDKIYQDAWLQLYFSEIPQEHIERQQVAFMQAALGGKNLYCGQTPPAAHKHMYITEELYLARQRLLQQAFRETNASAELIKQWLRIDDAFFNRIKKKSIMECQKRYKSDKVLAFENPNKV